jgi:hypothetical protein
MLGDVLVEYLITIQHMFCHLTGASYIMIHPGIFFLTIC